MACCTSWNQFWLLVWKNWLLQKKRIPLTLAIILLPALFAFVLIVLRLIIKSQFISAPTVFPSFPVASINYSQLIPPLSGNPPSRRHQWQMVYTPNNALTTKIMERAVGFMNMSSNVTGFDDEQDLVNFLNNSNIYFGGIVFLFGDDDSVLPNNIVYKIRLRAEQYLGSFTAVGNVSSASSTSNSWLTDYTYPSNPSVGPRGGNDTYGGSVPGYYQEGFLAIQRAVDLSLIQELNGNAIDLSGVEQQLKRYPYPPYNDDKFIIILQTQLPFVILLSFIVIAPTICKDLVLEKEKKLKEVMRLMGMRPWLHWSSWFFKFGIFMLISVLIMTILFHVRTKQGSIIYFSDPSVIFVFLLLYAISLITFCFAVSTFFSKASAAAAAGCIIYIVSYVPYFFLSFRYDSLTMASKIGGSIDYNLAMAFGCVKISQYEGLGIGLKWSNVAKPVSIDDGLTMVHIFVMLIIDSILYLIITWYFDALLPGDFGTPQPFYFPFTRWYWCGTSSSQLDANSFDDDPIALVRDDRKEYFEMPAPGAKVGIKIRGLTKQFNKKVKPAVDNLNIDMHEGNITALLGHNGAGKTTTMFMLTGFLAPTKGSAYVNGFDIRQDMLKIRRNLGLCPQHDVLFETLTVKEHLTFFAQLKGCTGEEVGMEVREMISVLHLEDKRDVQAKALSGGMKRKLCVGIALIAGSKFVILDEPTSGMDPQARRQTWDILQSQQKGRTMILSTHFMDEADLLGDRIAIMAAGEIQCFGTSMFLKNKYGIGYHMTLVKNPSCDVTSLRQLITNHVPESRLESNVGAEISFILPREQSNRFEGLFADLETNQKKLGIDSFGASITTMEEVFLKVGESVDSTLEQNLQNGQVHSTHTTTIVLNGTNGVANGNGHVNHATELDESTSYEQTERIEFSNGTAKMQSRSSSEDAVVRRESGLSWYLLQFYAMLVKRMIHSWRNWLVTLVQILVPVVLAIVACVIMVTLPGTKNLPALYLNLSAFPAAKIPYNVNETVGGDDYAGAVNDMEACYLQSASGAGGATTVSVPGDTTMDDFLLNIANQSMDEYNKNYIIGATIVETPGGIGGNASLIGYFNNAAYHTIAITLSYVDNALLRCLGGPNAASYSIETINHPLPWTLNTQINNNVQDAQSVGFIFAYCLEFGMAFLISTFVIFLIKERAVGAKHIQFVSGVHIFNFWLSTFVWDYINFLIPSALIIVVIEIFQVDGYSTDGNAGYVFLDLLLYGWSIIPCVYVISFLFQVASTGYVWLTVVNIFTGTAAVLTLFILQIPSLGVVNIGNALQWVFYVIFPNFCFDQALQDIYSNFQNNKICEQIDTVTNKTFFCFAMSVANMTNPCCPDACGTNCLTTAGYADWATPGIGRSLVFMAIQGFVFFLILLAIEMDVVGRAKHCCSRRASRVEVDGRTDAMDMGSGVLVQRDADVRGERDRIVGTPLGDLMRTNSVILNDLTKVYDDFLAVDQLCLGVPNGECFGLLGINGAGKTTSFKMLTGDVRPTSGSAYINGYSVLEDIQKVQQQLGYCPQFDALIDQLTVKETLWMFACLRGINKRDRDGIVDELIDRLTLKQYANKLAGNLSGGNKRKLSVAIALVGDPPIVFLDEPTTGMDPGARRLLWNTLTSVCKSGQTLVLTSHSMEECEALCTRLAIMVNGKFQCLGNIQHLKAKFSEGYTLMIKMKNPNPTDHDGQNAVAEMQSRIGRMMTFVNETFPGSVLKDHHEGLLNYQVYTPNVSWSRIFGTIERAKESFEIEDYSVSQTTLEQLFVSFARKQREPQDLDTSCGGRCKQLFCCCC